MTINYPLFVPPAEVADTTPRAWTRAEADSYLRWIVEVIDERVRMLSCFLKVEDDEDVKQLLLRVGIEVQRQLCEEYFARNGVLTNRGYALAADVGLLLAKVLFDGDSSLQWEVVRSPKRDVSYNLPVVVGFADGGRLEPIGVSVADAYGILERECESTVWADLYVSCSDSVAGIE